jgi:hypothetical protein
VSVSLLSKPVIWVAMGPPAGAPGVALRRCAGARRRYSALAAEEDKPNVVFILADNVGTATWALRRGRAARRAPRQIDQLPARVCASRSIWSSPAAHRRARR